MLNTIFTGLNLYAHSIIIIFAIITTPLARHPFQAHHFPYQRPLQHSPSLFYTVAVVWLSDMSFVSAQIYWKIIDVARSVEQWPKSNHLLYYHNSEFWVDRGSLPLLLFDIGREIEKDFVVRSLCED